MPVYHCTGKSLAITAPGLAIAVVRSLWEGVPQDSSGARVGVAGQFGPTVVREQLQLRSCPKVFMPL